MNFHTIKSKSILEKICIPDKQHKIDIFEFKTLIKNISERIGSPPHLFRNSPYLAEDPVFVFRGNPNHELHDALGYKNDHIPKSIDILCLGNSQVHSLNVPFSLTWPGILKSKTGCSLYNASMGSFSPIQYMLSLRELAFTKPSLVFLTFYTGNNVYNSMTTLKHASQSFRKLFPQYNDNLHSGFNNPDLDLITDTDQQVQIENFIRATKSCIQGFDTARVGNLTYFLMPTLRANVQDLNNHFVSRGFTLACQAIQKIARMIQKWNALLILIIMPTKEFLIYKRDDEYKDVKISSDLEIKNLGITEALAIQSLQKFCSENNIETLDLTNTLTNFIIDPIYNPMDIDGHPSLLGREIIAEYIFRYINSRKSQNSQ